MAHLGALQAFADANMQFDMVAGTSAGAIVGAMYCKGYSPTDISELLARLEYGGVALSVLRTGSLLPLVELLDDLLGGCDIADLPKPFAAVTTDLSDGSEVVLRSGNAARAVLASGSIPPLFRGIPIGDRVLSDGAFRNAVPGDVVRSLGADFVIGIALSSQDKMRERRFYTKKNQLVTVEQVGYAQCDLLLQPDLASYSAVDVPHATQMYDIGYECVMRSLPDIRRCAQAKRVNGDKGVRG